MGFNFDFQEVMLNLSLGTSVFINFALIITYLILGMGIIALVNHWFAKKLKSNYYSNATFLLNFGVILFLALSSLFLPFPSKQYVNNWKHGNITARLMIASIELTEETLCQRQEFREVSLGAGITQNKVVFYNHPCPRYHSTISCGEYSVIECLKRLEKNLEPAAASVITSANKSE